MIIRESLFATIVFFGMWNLFSCHDITDPIVIYGSGGKRTYITARKNGGMLRGRCLSNKDCTTIRDAHCISINDLPTNPGYSIEELTSKVCWCLPGFRQDEPKKSPSFECEDVYESQCSFNTSCEQLPDSHCHKRTKTCRCNTGYFYYPATKTCLAIEAAVTGKQALAVKNAHKSPQRYGAQFLLGNRCFLMYYPCDVSNSVCTPHLYIPYQGTCTCVSGYKPAGDSDCVWDGEEQVETPPTAPPTTSHTTRMTKTAGTTTARNTSPTQKTTRQRTTVKPPTGNALPCGIPGNLSSTGSFGLSQHFHHSGHSGHSTPGNFPHKIVGGTTAMPNEICWQAGVLSFLEDMSSYQYCGGSILNANWVLTASHCVVQNEDETQVTPVARMFVTIGATDFPKADPGSYCGKHHKVRRIVVHPAAEFVKNGQEFMGIANDLALLELEEPLDFIQSCVCTICLLDQRPAAGELCVISGFGCQDATCTSPPPHSLSWLQVAIEAKNSDRCQHGSDSLKPDSLVCIGSTLEKDACQGDSGGPLFCFSKERQRYYLAGATSYGFGDGDKKCAAGQLARYTDTVFFLDWIRQIIKK